MLARAVCAPDADVVSFLGECAAYDVGDLREAESTESGCVEIKRLANGGIDLFPVFFGLLVVPEALPDAFPNS